MATVPEIKVHRSLLTSLRRFDEDRFRWLDEAAAAGPLAALRMGPVKVWVVTDPELARTVLVTESAAWTRPPATVVPIRLGVGENLFTQSERHWAELQPALAPSFRRKAIDERLVEVRALVEEEVRAIPTDGTTVDLELMMGRIALSVAAWVLLGRRLDASQAEEIAAAQRQVVGWVGMRLGQLSGFLPLATGREAREMRRHRAVLDAYADDVITDARAAATPQDDVLGALIRARPGGRALTADQLRGHVLGLFLAGNETTAAALSWALVHGAGAPDEWAKVGDDPERYTGPFVTESLRLTPAVWGIPRTPTRVGLILDSEGIRTRVRRGQVVTVYLRGMNRDPKRWNDPLRFDPSRHEVATKEQHRALLPFGLGPRGCIGQYLALAEMDAVLPALARLGTFAIDGPAVEDARFALRVRGGLPGRFVPRPSVHDTPRPR